MESYFEKYCMAQGEWAKSHGRDEYVSESGIIGYRGAERKISTWYNHMPARAIRDLMGEEIWSHYFKFTVVRNPFDKLISGFFMYDRPQNKRGTIHGLKSLVKRMVGRGDPIHRVKGTTEVERFRSWIREGGAIIDRDKYLIDGKECLDYYIRFESLDDGIRQVCEQLSTPFEPARIPEFKKGLRHHRTKTRDYYDATTEKIVRNLYAWELEKFSYDLPE